MINGSQKSGESNSGVLLDRLNDLIKNKHDVKIFKSGFLPMKNEILKEIVSGDIIILSFPIFGDSIPSHTLKMLTDLEAVIKSEQSTHLIIYAMVNCGFYEGKQNHIAFEIIKHWCEHSGVKFGGGIGQGAGEMLGQLKHLPLEKSPFNNLSRALQTMTEKIDQKETFEVVYLNPYFPRFLWKFMGERHWLNLAEKNGLAKKDITKRI
jgi:hypothetical protein